jgi:hypothetical protein
MTQTIRQTFIRSSLLRHSVSPNHSALAGVRLAVRRRAGGRNALRRAQLAGRRDRRHRLQVDNERDQTDCVCVCVCVCE